MADITLSDYLAFILSEISRARDMADRYTREIALVYAKDDVLRHFSVPRFKLSKMDVEHSRARVRRRGFLSRCNSSEPRGLQELHHAS